MRVGEQAKDRGGGVNSGRGPIGAVVCPEGDAMSCLQAHIEKESPDGAVKQHRIGFPALGIRPLG